MLYILLGRKCEYVPFFGHCMAIDASNRLFLFCSYDASSMSEQDEHSGTRVSGKKSVVLFCFIYTHSFRATSLLFTSASNNCVTPDGFFLAKVFVFFTDFQGLAEVARRPIVPRT